MVRNFHANVRGAFLSGFTSGFAAPLALFTVHEAPFLPPVAPIKPPSQGAASSLDADWCRVGESLQVVIDRFERRDEWQSEKPAGG
jgi:hypothetical protein